MNALTVTAEVDEFGSVLIQLDPRPSEAELVAFFEFLAPKLQEFLFLAVDPSTLLAIEKQVVTTWHEYQQLVSSSFRWF